VVTDIVLEEESNGSESKEEIASDTQKHPTPIENYQFDLIKEKAPSEHCIDAKLLPTPKQYANLKLFPRTPDGTQVELSVNMGVWRSRTRSDGSQCRRPGLVPLNHNLFEQSRNKSSVLPSSRPASLTFSHLEKPQLAGSLSSLYRPLVTQKCAASDSKPAVYPFKQVECPF